jgi:TolB protein
VNADGSGLRQVTDSGAFDAEPHWSPNGQWIAYAYSSGGSEDIAILRGDGTGRRIVGHGTPWGDAFGAQEPWSPDGKELAWGGCGGLCVLDLASSRRRGLPLGEDYTTDFAWAPDGRELAAVDGDGALVVVDAGSGWVRTVLAAVGSSPAWSADGREVAFLAKHTLEVVSSEGGSARVLATRVFEPPRWSPHGRLLLFVNSRGPSGCWSPIWSGSTLRG